MKSNLKSVHDKYPSTAEAGETADADPWRSDLGRIAEDWRERMREYSVFSRLACKHENAAGDCEMAANDLKGKDIYNPYPDATRYHRVAAMHHKSAAVAWSNLKADEKKLHDEVTREIMRARVRALVQSPPLPMPGKEIALFILNRFGGGETNLARVEPEFYASVFEACDYAEFCVPDLDDFQNHEGVPAGLPAA